jgi:hypothetical protein
MKRLIDDMDAQAIWEYYDRNYDHISLFSCITRLCEPIPEWHTKLNMSDSQTWVLCFVSNSDPEATSVVLWVRGMESFRFRTTYINRYKYATPVDLTIKYRMEGRTTGAQPGYAHPIDGGS